MLESVLERNSSSLDAAFFMAMLTGQDYLMAFLVSFDQFVVSKL